MDIVSKKSVRGPVFSANLTAKILRPLNQVNMTVVMSNPTTNGTQPPWLTLVKLGIKNATSITKSNAVIDRLRIGFIRQRRCATKNIRIVVMVIVIVTATPYAAARLLDEGNAITRKTVAKNSKKFITGI